jgi:effector-binding domain-containing protein
MPRLVIKVGFTTPSVLPGDERVTTGELPAGTYAVMEYAGHYDGLVDAARYLLEWAEKNGVKWQKTDDPAGGEHWVSRIESYPTDPETEPNPDKWITELAFLTAE